MRFIVILLREFLKEKEHLSNLFNDCWSSDFLDMNDFQRAKNI